MKQKMKRYLAMILSLAMVFTMLPAQAVKAEGIKQEVLTTNISCGKFVASGTQNGTSNDVYVIATNSITETGSEYAAALVEGETAKNGNKYGSSRVGAMAFDLTSAKGISTDLITKATVKIYIPYANNLTSSGTSLFTKAALFRVASDKYNSMVSNTETDTRVGAATYPALNNDYSYASTVYSAEQITQGTETAGWRTFDVTDWVKASLEADDTYAIYRLQTVISGFEVVKTGDKQPVLSIESMVELTDEESVAAAKEALTIPTTTKNNLTLPISGSYGTKITWASSDEGVITKDGKVTRAEEDKEVTLTATITKGEKWVNDDGTYEPSPEKEGSYQPTASDTKEFKVTVQKKYQNDLIADYKFAKDGETITVTDTTRNGYDAELKGTGATVADGMLTLPGGAADSDAAYVELPGAMFEGEDTLTITTWLKDEIDSGDYAAMFFGTKTKHVGEKVDTDPDMPLHYWLLNPSKNGCFKSVWTDGDNASAPYSTETATSGTLTGSEWGLYTTVITPTEIIGYFNGVEVSRASKTKTTTDFGTDLVAFIGRSSYNDQYYKGGVYGVKVYGKALTQEEIWTEYYENYPKEITQQDLFDRAKVELTNIMLNENESVNSVVKPLSFPEELNNIKLTWTSSATNVIDANGKNVYTGASPKQITITVTGTYGVSTPAISEEIEITVESAIRKDAQALDSITIPNANNIKGNITLPATGEYGTPIRWVSDNPNVISVEEKVNDCYDNTPAGVVTRPATATATEVTLTASIEGVSDIEKKIKVKVQPAAAEITENDLTDYVMAYFVGDGVGQEKIYFATSRDGMNWEEIKGKDGNDVFLDSTLGEKGVRDPFILRSPERDKFYLIATDLCIAGRNWNWSGCQTAGSQAIMIWESDDLVNWSEQRMVTISDKIEAGCTWAPEIFYDDNTGEYIVFWASKVKADNYSKHRIYYVKTRDFYSFTEPKVWIDIAGMNTIDTTVVKDGGTYYRFTKNENGDGKYVFLEKATSLLGEWESVEATTLEAQKYVEGPCCFKFNLDDQEAAGYKWAVLLDDFGGIGYYPMMTDDLEADNFTKVTTANLPKQQKPRHGTVMRITSNEYQSLMSAYGTITVDEESVPSFVKSGYALPEKVNATIAGVTQEVDITWDKTAEDFAKTGEVTVTGIIPSLNNRTITKTIEVVADDLIYFIDAGVGSWNESKQESKAYSEVSGMEGIELRNETADQKYDDTKGSWGIVDADTAVGNMQSETDSIYANGWWANSGHNCEYVLPLESGTYEATGYFSEWWWTSGDNLDKVRKMNFYATYTNDIGKTVTTDAVAADVDGYANKQVKITFDVSNVAPGTKAGVHIIAYNNGADSVISGLAVRKLADGAAKEEARAEAVELIKSITVTPSEKSLYVGDTEKIAITNPEGLTEKLEAAGMEVESIKYRSGKTSVATVTSDGTIQAKAAGTATITTTITYNDGNKKELKTVITVQEKPAPDPDPNPTPDPNPNPAPGGGNQTPSGGDQTPGSGDQTPGSGDQTPVETTIKLDKSKLTLGEKETYTLKATVTGAEGQKVTWKSSKTSVATVSSKGKITAKKKGTANITATVDGKTVTCKVTVKTAPKKITLNAKSKQLKKGGTFRIKVKLPKNTASNKITYTSSKKSVATVSSTGKITAKKKGKATITVKTFNGKKATIKITVK